MFKGVYPYEIVNFSGFYKLVNVETNCRVGGLYSTYKDAYESAIKYKRDDLGINIKKH